MNTLSYNEWAYNSPSTTALLLLPSLAGITIGGFALCSTTTGISMQYNNRKYDNKFYENQFIDGQRLISHLIKQKSISLRFILKASDNDALQLLIDEFKSATSWQKTGWVVALTVTIGWEVRVLKVIVEDTDFNDDGITTAVQTGTMTLVAVDPPRFYSFNLSTKYYLGISAPFTGQITNVGNAIAYPVYYIVFNSAVAVTWLSLQINGYTVTISETIVTGDIVVISSDIYNIIKPADVYLNDVPIDYTGQVTTELTTGTNAIEFDCTGTSYDIDITVLYHAMRE